MKPKTQANVKRTRRRLGRRGGFSRNKLTRRLLHLYRSFVLHLLKQLHGLGVSTVYLSYPFNVAQDKGNEFTVNMWSYRKLMGVIELNAQEYGMKAFEVVEYNASKYCAYHDVEVARNPRGVISCPEGYKLHSDLNGALNILKKATGMVISTIEKPLSFAVDHNGVASVKVCNTRDLGEPSPFRAKKRSVVVLRKVKNWQKNDIRGRAPANRWAIVHRGRSDVSTSLKCARRINRRGRRREGTGSEKRWRRKRRT